MQRGTLDAGALRIGDGESISRRNIWFGHEFVDEETMQHVRSVVVAAGVMAALQVVSLLLALLTKHHFEGALVNFMLGMILPGCGYCGATRTNSELMCCFSCTSLLSAISQMLLMLNSLLAIWFISENEEVFCEALCQVTGCGNHSRICSCQIGCGESCCSDFAEVCQNGQQLLAPMSCIDFEATLGYKTHVAATVIMLISPLVIGLSVYAWHHGRKLYERLSAGEVLLVRVERRSEDEAFE